MILIKNGCVHNGRGQVKNTDLLIEDGKIVQIGEASKRQRSRGERCGRDAGVSRLIVR